MPLSIQFAFWGIGRWLKSMGTEERMEVLISAISYVLKLDFLDGYRTTIAGVASMLSGLTLLAFAAAGDPRGDVKTGMEALLAGMALIGHAGKADKQLAELKAQTAEVKVQTAEIEQQRGRPAAR